MTEGRLALPWWVRKIGVITDGDLRRLLVNGRSCYNRSIDVASPMPLTIGPDSDDAAEAKMLESRVQCLVVVNDAGHVDGVIQVFE